MPSAVRLREDYPAEALRALARRSKDVNQSRRLLSLAAVLDGMDRGAAAKIGGMDRQTLRDWVHRFNACGPCQAPSWKGLIDSWCKSLSYNGIIRARSNSTPARPYMARLRLFSLLICPSVCPLLQGSDIALRTASRSWRIVFAKRCIA
jgi:hypothetical protein